MIPRSVEDRLTKVEDRLGVLEDRVARLIGVIGAAGQALELGKLLVRQLPQIIRPFAPMAQLLNDEVRKLHNENLRASGQANGQTSDEAQL